MSLPMDKDALQTSSRRWMQAALEELGQGESMDFAVHHVGVGLEHLLKSYLCSLHPTLVIDSAHWPSLLHAVGYGDRAAIPASRTKSIGLKLAFERVRALLKSKVTVSDAGFELVLAARNGIAHVGAHETKEARAALATCIRIATPVLTELGIHPRHYWGHYRELAQQLADEQVTELRVTFEAKLAHAKRSFQQRIGGLPQQHRAAVLAALGATSTASSDYDLQIGCPACEGDGWLHGITEIDWSIATDVDTGEPTPTVVFHTDWFTCAICGLELRGDELELANIDREHYLGEDPSEYTALDEDLAYEQWRDDRLTDP